MDYNRIIMFCDYGLDDAIATLHILDNADKFDMLDIVPIGGNVSVQTAFRNAHTLLAAAKVENKNIRIIDTRSIEQCAADIPDVHGKDGIGDLFEEKTSNAAVIDFEAFKTELEKTKNPSRDCVLSLGPCTIPIMLGYAPFCTVLMGGTTNEKPNYGKYEFNEAMDVPAFKKLAYAATAVATLDTCHDKTWDFDKLALDTELGNKLVKRYIELCKARSAHIAVYDYVAALAVTHPERFDAVRVRREDGAEYNELRIKN